MTPIKKAWSRGKEVRARGHLLDWYAISLAKYSEPERAAFMAGYAGLPCPGDTAAFETNSKPNGVQAMTPNEQLAYEAMMAALRVVIEANQDFRNGMPEDWEGDPLQDACETAKKALDFAKANLATGL